MAQNDPVFAAGVRVDGYVIDAVVGAGAAAQIFRALDERSGATVVLKVPRSDSFSDAELRRRFRREGRITRTPIGDPHVQRNMHDGRRLSTPYLVLSYVDGHNLRTELHRCGGTAPSAIVLDWAVQLSTMLSAIHAAGILHRDLKPENIVIDRTGRLHLIDFGDAAWLDRSGGRYHILSGLQGTAEYLSPEQILGRPLDVRSDLYGLGAVLYESLAGRPPFEAAGSSETLDAHLRDAIVDITDVRSDVERRLASAVHATLRRRPEERPADASAFRALLDSDDDHLESRADDPPLRGNASSATVRALVRLATVVSVSFLGVSAIVVVVSMLLS